MKKRSFVKVAAFVCAMAVLLTGCSKGGSNADKTIEDPTAIENTVEDGSEADGQDADDKSSDQAGFQPGVSLADHAEDAKALYKEVAKDIPGWVHSNTNRDIDYTECMYYYYDYNKDDIVDMILILSYKDGDENVNDEMYLYYNVNENKIMEFATMKGQSADGTIAFGIFDDNDEFTRYCYNVHGGEDMSYMYASRAESGGLISELMEELEFINLDASVDGFVVLSAYQNGDVTPFE